MTALVQVRALTKSFAQRGGRRVHALRGVDLDIARGAILGLVGESGCGKTTLGRCLLNLVRPTSGAVRFDGVELASLGARRMRPFRRRMQIIFQDPLASLDPTMTVEQAIAEPLRIHRLAAGRSARAARVSALLDRVGLARGLRGRLPHELSAGQRQRVGIARALAVQPEFIVADEPVSALDVSIQAQIANLLLELRRDSGLTYLFISHDLRMVHHLCDEIAVMYLGRVVELAAAPALYARPRHPYTQALIAAHEPGAAQRPVEGEPPSPLAPPPGCAFAPRCAVFARRHNPRCTAEDPALAALSDGHRVACHEARR